MTGLRAPGQRYELQEIVGSGGTAQVWRAWDRVLQRDIAVKHITAAPCVAADDLAGIRRYAEHEARAAARVNHPGVARLYDLVDLGGFPAIVGEYVPARSLRELVDNAGLLPPGYVAAVGAELAAALAAVHRAGVLHRDVKPSNVLVASGRRVVLTDFGIAHIGPGDDGGEVLGTPAYAPPERLLRGVSLAAGDVWSLGATLYTAVEGRPPHLRRSVHATLIAVAGGVPDPPHRAGPLWPLIRRMLQPDPVCRPGIERVRGQLCRLAAAGGADRSAAGPRRTGDRRPSRPDHPAISTVRSSNRLV
ncbi:hypothetical protein Val02_50230 [Virgisporangium aliadipatigenens]|uniref:non-specific serine/threonine protein kinase n=1 Tax=Virgisporangium aliadipatigenens TaxID=741659 RepID=A0A8J3YPE6_9ACTN|nr:serine/threonine-protein kinase [Virgisporangium aliadipatigenens]GIJ48137.1 hypothetical protein Val02_50230 [Virgisporangium aliadipatigenens]